MAPADRRWLPADRKSPRGSFGQPQELADIASSYLAFGLEPPAGGDERVDHVACECEFMDFLARKQAFALGSLDTSEDQEGAKGRLATVRGAARGFLRDHPRPLRPGLRLAAHP